MSGTLGWFDVLALLYATFAIRKPRIVRDLVNPAHRNMRMTLIIILNERAVVLTDKSRRTIKTFETRDPLKTGATDTHA